MRWMGAYVHGFLLLVALGLVYRSWKSPEEHSPGPAEQEEVVVWNKSAPPEAVVYKEGDKTVTIKAYPNDKQALPDIEVVEVKKEAKKHEAEKPDNTRPPEKENGDPGKAGGKKGDTAGAKSPSADEKDEKIEKVTRFKGNRKAIELLEGLAGLKAKRALGKPDQEQMATLGLEPPEASLEVRFGAGVEKVLVGKATYGTAGRYIMVQESGEVFVAGSELISNLKWAKSRLKETDPFGKDLKKSASDIAMTTPAGTISMTRMDKDNEQKGGKEEKAAPSWPTGKWALSDKPDEESEDATEFVKKFFRLRARKYLSTLEQGGNPQGARKVLTASLASKSTSRTFTLFERAVQGEGQKNKRYLLASPRLGYYVEVSPTLAKDVIEASSRLLPAE